MIYLVAAVILLGLPLAALAAARATVARALRGLQIPWGGNF